jgi:hypothetical protein
MEEDVEIDRAQLNWAPGHVEADGGRVSGGFRHANLTIMSGSWRSGML